MTKNSKKGFTIIEVVLVLAIAGLIFLMVFIALPALQRSQRNTRRRQDMARIMSAVTDYQANHNGNLPLTPSTTTSAGGTFQSADLDTDFPIRYIEENLSDEVSDSGNVGIIGRKIYTFKCQEGKTCDHFSDPDGSIYKIAASGPSLGAASGYIMNFDHVVYITSGVICSSNSEEGVEATNNANDSAVRYVLEGGSVYCNDNK